MSYDKKFKELFTLIDLNNCETITTLEVIFTLLQFKDLLPDLDIDRFVSDNEIKPKEKDPEIGFEEFKTLITSIIN
jgi:Ca2+-binding EF-hand superfamily protein